MPLTAAEQGVEGEQVKHVDQETHTGDWMKEYGPKGPPPHHSGGDLAARCAWLPCAVAMMA